MAYTREIPGGGFTAWVDRGPFGFNIGTPDGNQAAASAMGAAFGTAGNMANAFGNAYGTYGQGFNQYTGALASLANSQANLKGNQYAAYGSAETARQNALGQLGTAALAGYGNAANAAQQSWAANQTGYMKAMADMMGANQYATSQYGTGRETALSNLGNAYSNAGTGFANARTGLANAYGGLAGQGAQAYGNLAGALGLAGSNLGSSANQALGTMRGAAMNSMGNLGAAGAGALGTIGGTANNALGTVGGAAQNAFGTIGGNTANASGMLGASANNAYGTLGTAFGNAMGGVNQAALQGMSNLGAAGQGTLGALGTAGANMAGQFGNVTGGIGQTAANFTRDLAKLGLARELGLGQVNVASQGIATGPYTAGAIGGSLGNIFGGGGGNAAGGAGVSIGTPDGTIASGSFGPDYFGGGGAVGAGGGAVGGGGGGYTGGAPSPISLNPYANVPWYQQGPQAMDGGALASLNKLAGQGFDYLGATGRDSMSGVREGYGAIGDGASQANARLSGLNLANNAFVGDTTAAGQQALRNNAALGYGNVLSGLDAAANAIGGSSRFLGGAVNDAINSGYSSIGSQANRGAGDIMRAAQEGYGYLSDMGNQGFSGIGQSLLGGFGGIGAESNNLTRTERDTFGGLRGLRDSITNSPVLAALSQNYGASLGALRDSYNASRNDPRRMMGDALAGLSGLNAMNLAASGSGMDQFYRNANSISSVPFDQYRNDLNSGFGALGSRLGATQSGIRQLYDDSVGNLDVFQTPAQMVNRERDRARAQDALDAERRRVGLQNTITDLEVDAIYWDPIFAKYGPQQYFVSPNLKREAANTLRQQLAYLNNARV